MPDFFYDEQIRRYILQFLRMFSNYKIELPPDENGVRVQKRIPIIYGDMSRQVANILKGNSQNTTLMAPAMSGYITNVEMAPERRQDTMGVSQVRAIERFYNEQTGQYSTEAGNRYMIDRYMPVPYTLTMNLDIWTTNTTDKAQLLEQILVVYNPSVQLQTNDNPLDWSTITEIELTNITWSSRGVPQGTDSANDIATLTFKVPIWINPPAKIKRQKIIEQIVLSIYDVDLSEVDLNSYDPFHSSFDQLTQSIITPGQYRIAVTAIDSTTSKVELLTSAGQSDPSLTWESLVAAYGKIDPDTTVLRLKTLDDIEDNSGDVLGTLEVSDTEPNVAVFTVDEDTLPTTIPSGPVNAIVDPKRSRPGDGTLPAASAGQRYLLISSDDTGAGEPIIAQGSAWGIVAWENDIIEFDGTNWFVSFDSQEATPPLYVVNLDNGQHYKYTGSEGWVYTYLAEYNPGYWRIEL